MPNLESVALSIKHLSNAAPPNGCLGGAAVRRRTRDRKVAGSTPGRGAIGVLGGASSLVSGGR